MTVMTLKVPEALDHKLRAVAKRRGISKSAVVRKAVETYIEQDLPVDDEPSAYDLLRDLVGSVKGPGDLSHNPEHMKGYGS
jgi:predicted DNA-binding protein